MRKITSANPHINELEISPDAEQQPVLVTSNLPYTKGRAVGYNIDNRFTLKKIDYTFADESGLSLTDAPRSPKTRFNTQQSKKIISRNHSPDIAFEQSINPYQGCEHGCIYCYARPSHAYLELSPGLDFESQIFIKPDASILLRKELSQKGYTPKVIHLGGNTDCYQPVEQRLKITRSLLEVMLETHHPVTLITKNALILRDIDLLAELARLNLVHVFISMTSLNNDLMRIMEPRTSSPAQRLKTLKTLIEADIPTSIMTAPIIPYINDHELEDILAAVVPVEPHNIFYNFIRLPYEVKDLFKDWLQIHFPDRSNKVISVIKDIKGGKENETDFGARMRGTGPFAQLIDQRFKLALKKLLFKPKAVILRTDLFEPPERSGQMDLF